MSALTNAIVAHDLEAIERIIAERPEQIQERVVGWLPIEWAERTGSWATCARVTRLLGPDAGPVDHRALLRRALRGMAGNYFGPVDPERSARRAWEQLRSGYVRPIDKWEPDFILSDDFKVDLEYLIAKTAIDSEEALVALAAEKDPPE